MNMTMNDVKQEKWLKCFCVRDVSNNIGLGDSYKEALWQLNTYYMIHKQHEDSK